MNVLNAGFKVLGEQIYDFLPYVFFGVFLATVCDGAKRQVCPLLSDRFYLLKKVNL